MKKLISLLLIGVMTLSLVSCGNTQTSSSLPSSESSAAPVSTVGGEDELPDLGTVDVYTTIGIGVGKCTGWMPDYIKSKINLEMNNIAGDSTKFDLMLAAGDLPDVVTIDKDADLTTAIKADLLMDLDEVKDKLPNLYNSPECCKMMQFLRDRRSADTGKLYGLARSFSTEPAPTSPDRGGFILRYDYYGEIGYPELKGYDDLLNALKAMQTNHAATEDGQKVYGLSLFTDWDNGQHSGWGYMSKNMGFDNGLLERDYHNYIGNENVENIVFRSFLDDDSGYKAFMKFLWKANQMGLLDPDSSTQTFDDFKSKTLTGRVLMSFDTWNTDFSIEEQEKGIGFCRVPNLGDPFVAEGDQPRPGGSGTVIAISKKCKNLDGACALLNLMFTPEYVMTYKNGLRGETWDQKEDGTPYLVSGGYEKRVALDMSTRGSFVMLTFNGDCPLPGFNGYNADYTNFPCEDEKPEDSLLIKNYKEHSTNGLPNCYAYLKSIDNICLPKPTFNIELSEDMKLIENRVNEEVRRNNFNLILASSEEEFEKCWSEMRTKCEDMGLQSYLDTKKENTLKGIEIMKPYYDSAE